MSKFERFDRHKTLYCYLVIAGYFIINNGINASSVWMEHSRSGSPAIQVWEPVVWEYSSALSAFLLLPFLANWFARHPPKLHHAGRQLLMHLIGSLVFAVCHVAIMVWIRELVYGFNDGNYDFGPVGREFWYEYRKDALGYTSYFILFYMFRFIYSRLKGEANFLDSSDDIEPDTAAEKENSAPEHLLVKKLDKEFLLKITDIEWMESSGNYVNLYSNNRIYPLRSTLSTLVKRIESKGFSRIHRSFAVNHQAIDSISYLPSGDGEIQLKSGRTLNLSRRYKEGFKGSFR